MKQGLQPLLCELAFASGMIRISEPPCYEKSWLVTWQSLRAFLRRTGQQSLLHEAFKRERELRRRARGFWGAWNGWKERLFLECVRETGG